MLARRDYTLYEIRKKLKKAHHAMLDIVLVTTELVESHYINDLRIVENYLQQRRAKGYGPLRIIMELEVRGILPETIAEEVKITDNAWMIDAQKAWQKHFKSMPTNFKSKAKQMRFLHNRGFTQEQINGIFKNNEMD
jgi:regulatory protein